jgi:uncharacterized membrane protein (UPF0127 family)
MPNQKKDNSFVLSTIIIGIIGLTVLTIYLSSKNALPKISDFYDASMFNASSTITITAPHGNINTEVSSTTGERELGLSGRTRLAPDSGMLFIFPNPGIYGFWMKDMNFPIDIVWIDESHNVVSINSDVATSTYPDSLFPPSNISYVLELNAGAAREFGIATGTSLVF